MRSLSLKPLAIAAAAVSLIALAGCANKNAQTRADTNYVARDVNTLYNAGKNRLDRGQYKLAAACSTRSSASIPIRPGRAARS
jgi:outer membrane protein assembly factor BamD